MRYVALAVGLSILGGIGSMSAQAVCAKSDELVLAGAGGRGNGGPGGGGPTGSQPAADGQAPPTAPPPQGIYAACLNTTTGRLTLLGMKAAVTRASWVLADPKKSMVYTTGGLTPNMRDGGTIFAFHVDPATGALEPRGTSPSGGSDPTHLAWDAHSGTLFVANHGEGIIGVIKTGPDGAIQALSDKAQQEGSGPSPRQKNAEAHGVTVDPTGRFVLSADFGADKIYVYRYDGKAGKLTPSNPAFITTPPGSGPRHITFSPDGKYVVMNTELNGQVRVYSWHEATGTLEQTQVVDPYPMDYRKEDKSAAEIEFSKDGRFFYLTLRGKEDKLLTYRWDGAAGKLAEVDRISTGATPWSFGLDPSGKWLLVANSSSGTISTFAVDKMTGKLTPKNEPLKLSSAMTIDFLSQ